jgi:hypothetical protein
MRSSFLRSRCAADSSSRFQADGLQRHALIEAVDLRSALFFQLAVSFDGPKQACRERSVYAFEELEEDKRDGVATWQQALSALVRQFLDEPLCPKLGKVIAQRCEAVLRGLAAERLDDVG